MSTWMRTGLPVLMTGLLLGCGWHTGVTPPASLRIGEIEGSTVEARLRADLRAAIARGLSDRGVKTGDRRLDVRILSIVHAPAAAVVGQGVTAWTTRLEVGLQIEGAQECASRGRGERTWTVSVSDPAAAADARWGAVRDAADEAVGRGLDALLARPRCR